jgi:hypothetical protein
MRQPDEVTRERAEEDMERGDAIPMPAPGRKGGEKAHGLMDEREVERDEGILPEDRGSPAAPSDRPENRPPHPQDVNDISRE